MCEIELQGIFDNIKNAKERLESVCKREEEHKADILKETDSFSEEYTKVRITVNSLKYAIDGLNDALEGVCSVMEQKECDPSERTIN